MEVIVGRDHVSNKKEELFIYSQDPGASNPRPVNFVIMPRTTEEVQKIVLLANKEKLSNILNKSRLEFNKRYNLLMIEGVPDE